MFDFIAYPLGKFLLFIYNLAFHNYGLAIIIFTLIVRLAMLPLTLKQYKSTAKMQEIQPLINDIQKRYKDDREKLNQELMKLYQEHNYNPAGGCLPMLIQFPIILTLYWVIVQPLKFMLSKSSDAINKIVEVAAKGVEAASKAAGATTGGFEEIIKSWGTHKEIEAMNYFFEHQESLPQVAGYLEKSELIDFTNFLGLHLGKTATYDLNLIKQEPGIYIPLLLLVVIATVTTYISGRLTVPGTGQGTGGDSKNKATGCSNSMMVLMGPVMTLAFSFQLPAGVILYWTAGYVVGIIQQLYVNKHILKKHEKPAGKEVPGKRADADGGTKALKTGGEKPGEPDENITQGTAGGTGAGNKRAETGKTGKKGSRGGGQKGKGKKGGKKK